MTVRERAREALDDVLQGDRPDGFRINAGDFLSARELGAAVSTRIEQKSAGLADAAETVNRSFPERDDRGRFTNVISPLVIPDQRFALWPIPVALIALFGLLLSGLAVVSGALSGPGRSILALLGPHLWLLLLAIAAIGWWRRSVVMIPDGCQALITRFGRLEQIVGAGRTTLLNPWKRVSYIVNTTREYPYNAPIREAPTASRVNASVDIFLQFKIEDPAEFVFTLGGVKGFSDKLENAISEVTRALIYQQRAEAIYDLVGESTQTFLDSLNQQFLPAVRFSNANITHAEPSSQEYRMDLAAPEMVRVAKEAYTYQYELQLNKEQNEGELNKELASLRETLSAIRAEIATYQAQMDTARERETNRANARARERLVEAESSAKANAALLEAQALDIRAVSGSAAPEILEYRFQQEVLEHLANVSARLPQIVQIGAKDGESVDFLEIAQGMIGSGGEGLYTADDLRAIRERLSDIQGRIRERSARIETVMTAERTEPAGARREPAAEEVNAQRVEEIRRSVTDESIQERVERIAAPGDGPPAPPPDSAQPVPPMEDNTVEMVVRPRHANEEETR
jgi:regulator of protease activity HflC (stomatin/prohibitin superfamily)